MSFADNLVKMFFMRRNPYHSLLRVFYVFLLCSCSAQTPISTPLASVTSTPLLSTAFPSATPSSAITTPEISDTPLSIATQFCMGIASDWSCTCGDLSTQYIDIKNADKAGVCEITLPRAYRIHLSDDWYCNIAGAAAINLSCMTAYGQRIFVQSVFSELTVDKADETISRFCEGEGCSSDPVIDPDEEKIEKELITIGDKSVLRLLSKQKEAFLLRYFIKNNDNLYVFRVESKDRMEIKGSTTLLEATIHSMEFVP